MKKILLILLIIGAGFYAQAQNNERIKAFKTAYITEQLNLNSAEAEKFWPIYNEFESRMQELRRQERKEIHQKLRTGFDTMSDREAEALIEKAMQIRAQEFQLGNELYSKLRGVVSAKKIIKLKIVEDDFKRRLLERIKKRKGNNN